MDPNLLKGHLDLILLAIVDGDPKYGLEISKEAQLRTDGYFDLKVGSLYPALHRLEQAGWLSGEFRPAPRGGAPVKYYQLTDAGRGALRDKQEQFSVFSRQIGRLTAGR
ncbi:DNA-binding PadR family transcriptional regulator [Deinococcus metalli]|uniref:PadR family transcriptional regulator n=1 Tax=Deinococcus metalli TaxID=1141878 RepID=A0A7W8NQQ3_9DEIO|nr:PadR family transcriptional regulator [Deinococcus metalli]MBB5376098.1 DNA-binding PadR family transcriptional regulator [Deinococcus metalli]GHF40808.1 PadR family transcriptional regulator [Deinococcus metalli]